MSVQESREYLNRLKRDQGSGEDLNDKLTLIKLEAEWMKVQNDCISQIQNKKDIREFKFDSALNLQQKIDCENNEIVVEPEEEIAEAGIQPQQQANLDLNNLNNQFENFDQQDIVESINQSGSMEFI